MMQKSRSGRLRRSRRQSLKRRLQWQSSLIIAGQLAVDPVMMRDGLRVCYPRRGQYRALAAHMVMEAFDLRPYQVAKLSGVDRRHISRAHARWWANRDAWTDLDHCLRDAIASLRKVAA
ncbi:MAG: hypothetical protein MRY72_13105 [Aquisalinus sp.]|nr:hypothetical protein [Aquisalinus sp.]